MKRDSTPFGYAHSSKKIMGSEARRDHLSIGGKKSGSESFAICDFDIKSEIPFFKIIKMLLMYEH